MSAARPAPEWETGGGEDAERARLRLDATRFLRIRERTTLEVARYLERRGFAAPLVQQALSELTAERLVDDRRFAEMYVRDRRRLRPMSRAAVLRDLRTRGVSAETAAEALDACDPPWDDTEVAVELLRRRWRRWASEDRRVRAARLLTQRGFSGGVIRAAITRASRAGSAIDEEESAP